MSGRAAGEEKQGFFWRTIRAAHVVHRRRMHPGMIASEPATLPARRARDNPWFSLRHSLIQIHVIGFIAFRPIPGMPRGGVLPPTPVLAPGAALGSRPRVALSSAQVTLVYPAALGSDNFLLLGVGASPGRGRRRLLSAPGPAVVRVQPT